MQHNGLDSRKLSGICWGSATFLSFITYLCHNGFMGLRVKANKMYSENRLKAERKAHTTQGSVSKRDVFFFNKR